MPFRVRSEPEGNRRRQGSGLLHTRRGGGRGGTPKQKQEQGSCQEPLPGKDSGSSVRHTPPEGAGPRGAADPRISPRLCAARQDRKETVAPGFVRTGSLCGISPTGLRPASAGERWGGQCSGGGLPPRAELLEGPLQAGPRRLASAHLPAPANSLQCSGLPPLCPVPRPTYGRPGPTTGLFTGGGGGGLV